MKKFFVIATFVLATAAWMMAQNATSTIDVLGAHNNNGRGCAGCHSPHSGSFGSGHGGAADAGSYALWGQDASPLYGQTLLFGDGGRYSETLPSTIATGSEEVGGILLCLSCHDGNLTANNMMTGQSYEQSIGYLTNTAYGSTPIPTLLGNDGTTAGNYMNDHPVGQNATIRASASNGLVFSNNVFSYTAGSNYEKFVSNYGWPALAPGKWSNPYAINAAGSPYVLCTTCHNQHVMTIYTSTAASPIANDGGGKYYATMFFINGPYNPNMTWDGASAPSTTQFCRECHFGEANEANNTFTIHTQFQ